MASDAEVEYHRSFLSPFYVDNITAPNWWEKVQRKAWEVEEIRVRNSEALKAMRKPLARLCNVQYTTGRYMTAAQGDVGGPSTKWSGGNPSDDSVAECMSPTYPPQGSVKHPTTGALA